MLFDIRDLFVNFFMPTAEAQASPLAGGGSFASMIIMFALMFLILYFLIIRPQQKRMKAHQAMLAALQKNDEVVTQGGLRGTVVSTNESDVVVRIADGIEVTVVKSSISQAPRAAAPKK